MPHKTQDFDLVVIGSGPGGHRAAIQAAKAGKRVALIERYAKIGGGCLHWGTIPSKSLRESVYRYSLSSKGVLGRLDQASYSAGDSLRKIRKDAQVDLPDMRRLMQRKERVLHNESDIYEHQLKRNNIKVFYGQGRFVGPQLIEVVSVKGDAHKLHCKIAVIAVGARPVAPSWASVDGVRVLDSNTVLDLKHMPKSMIVFGAGVIGCEYASIFQAAGTKVFLVDKKAEILGNIDREIVSHMIERFSSLGMDIQLEADVKNFEMTEAGVRVALTNGQTLEAETSLIAMGRQGNTDGLGLDVIGLEADARGQVKVGDGYQTSVPWVYAVGDVIGFPALASTAMEQGRIAVCSAFGLNEQVGKLELYPYGIYTIPEISTLGQSEEDLTRAGIPFAVGRARYKELARGQIIGDEWGMLKLIVHRETHKLLGVHIIGDNAADLIHIGQAVMHFNGDLEYFVRNVFNYPTLAEAYKTAALNVYNQLMGRPSSE
jgi:NAD(P) transhydrogenase